MAGFKLKTTARFERLFRSLLKRHPELLELRRELLATLSDDPYNSRRQHQIRKLTGVKQGYGAWRLRIGRWRFRYDIEGDEVILSFCGLRDESTYR